jgi:hypothetical protein
MVGRGALAEWLGTGLQNPVHRFDSGRRLASFQAETALLAARSAPNGSAALSAQIRSSPLVEGHDWRATGAHPGECVDEIRGLPFLLD